MLPVRALNERSRRRALCDGLSLENETEINAEVQQPGHSTAVERR
jgi:hypothetical protein